MIDRRYASALVVLVALALNGCSTAAAQPHRATPAVPHFAIGASAARIASAIKGCSDVEAQPIGAGGPTLVSAATCHLGGHLVDVNSWESSGDQILQAVVSANGHEAYYATANGWTVTMGDDATLQMQLTNDAAGLLKQSFSGETPPPADIDGEKTVAEMVVKSIGGAVVHFAG